jgi:hypothetical protein
LFPGSIPINNRPYRYTPQQKDEIEKQVARMLQARIVVPSLSPFASPVLLVKKWLLEILCGLQEAEQQYHQE